MVRAAPERVHDLGRRHEDAQRYRSVSVGGPVININGNPDARTIGMIRDELATWSRGLAPAIDARVTDRLKRGAY